MFLEFKHGGHALTEAAAAQRPAAFSARSDVATPQKAGTAFDPDTMTPFRYIVPEVGADDLLPASAATVQALDALGNAMIEQPDTNPDAVIPPIYTYWSQFIDHELTARTDTDAGITDITLDVPDLKPVSRHRVEKGLLNRRTPALELDCVYGDGVPGRHGGKSRQAAGPTLQLARKLRDGAKMRIGTAEVVNGPGGEPVGPVPPPAHDLNRDLPRIGALLDQGVVKAEDFPESLQSSPTFRQRAFIGDPRNDENLVVAQFHLAILRFHNAVVDWLKYKDPRQEQRDTAELFEDARRIVRWTFQWLVVNDFLKTVARADVVEKVLQRKARLYQKEFDHGDEPFMPIEFSVACYRFGHSMIRDAYDFNRNFGRKPEGGDGFVIKDASLNLLFLFTGKSGTPFAGGQILPHNWIIEWDRFDGSAPHDADDGQPARVARNIDTHLAPSLGTMANEGNDATVDRIKDLLKHLARRNLRRGYQLSVPTGQAMARALGVQPLTPAELGQNSTPAMTQAMTDGGFLERTPLWFYVLKEAEVREGGQRLGEVGSRIVAETFIGVLLNDEESYLAKDPSWSPAKKTPGSGGPLKLQGGGTIQKIGDLLKFAGVRA